MSAQSIMGRALQIIAEKPGASDREIAEAIYGPGSLGTLVNKECRELADQGLTRRRLRPDYLLGNWLVKDDPHRG